MNILLTSAGRRRYLVQYFKEALRLGGCGGLVMRPTAANVRHLHVRTDPW